MCDSFSCVILTIEMLDHFLIVTSCKKKNFLDLNNCFFVYLQAGNIWLDKFGGGVPYVRNLRSKRYISEFTLPSIPEKLYSNL